MKFLLLFLFLSAPLFSFPPELNNTKWKLESENSAFVIFEFTDKFLIQKNYKIADNKNELDKIYTYEILSYQQFDDLIFINFESAGNMLFRIEKEKLYNYDINDISDNSVIQYIFSKIP